MTAKAAAVDVQRLRMIRLAQAEGLAVRDVLRLVGDTFDTLSECTDAECLAYARAAAAGRVARRPCAIGMDAGVRVQRLRAGVVVAGCACAIDCVPVVLEQAQRLARSGRVAGVVRGARVAGGAKVLQRDPGALGPPQGLALRVVRAAIAGQLVHFGFRLTARCRG